MGRAVAAIPSAMMINRDEIRHHTRGALCVACASSPDGASERDRVPPVVSSFLVGERRDLVFTTVRCVVVLVRWEEPNYGSRQEPSFSFVVLEAVY